ncbi:unnamed protein product, partial [Iphiclides podalirius]
MHLLVRVAQRVAEAGLPHAPPTSPHPPTAPQGPARRHHVSATSPQLPLSKEQPNLTHTINGKLSKEAFARSHTR